MKTQQKEKTFENSKSFKGVRKTETRFVLVPHVAVAALVCLFKLPIGSTRENFVVRKVACPLKR